MGKIFQSATQQETLTRAWRKIRANGLSSAAEETVSAVRRFDSDAFRNIIRLQRRLRNQSFRFDPQKGVLKSKSDGGKRGIVMASVQNRIVERALLDSLQTKVPYVGQVIRQPTSVGGVPHRSVPHALSQIESAFDGGSKFFVRSDISGFFDNIPRVRVLEELRRHIDDEEFLSLLDTATTVTLANESTLGEDRKAFPCDEEGVAQGSPLSALFGNILLHDFDLQFNGRGITCIRFIDDFVMLGANERQVRKAFDNAKVELSSLNLNCHDPFSEGSNKKKTERGHVNDGFVFLGYDIRPGLLQPSHQARQKLLCLVDDAIRDGKQSIKTVHAAGNSFERPQRYAQTLVRIDRTLRGWGNSFAYGNAGSTILDLDKKVDRKLASFRTWFRQFCQSKSASERRRVAGVGLLTDIERKSLSELPFVVECKRPFRKSKKTQEFSTDGSVISSGDSAGPGGWAVVEHDSGVERSGREPATTNNQMELRAVVEALRWVPVGGSVIITTDSEYVERTFNTQQVAKANIGLWREFVRLASVRHVKIEWIRGHSGNPHNERADRLARSAAKQVRQDLVE